jgi:putative PIN family toxin of toxin-antitoxin system
VILAVLDTNVFVAAVGWRGASYRVVVAAARRQVRLVVTREILDEYAAAARRVGLPRGFAARVEPALRWLERSALWVDPAPLGKRRSRDATDDQFLAAALASGARQVVAYDNDLLTLGKPFGVTIQRPEAFLRTLEERG